MEVVCIPRDDRMPSILPSGGVAAAICSDAGRGDSDDASAGNVVGYTRFSRGDHEKILDRIGRDYAQIPHEGPLGQPLQEPVMQPQLAIAAVPYSLINRQRPVERLRDLATTEPRASALRFLDRDGWQVLNWCDLQLVVVALSDQLNEFGFAPDDHLLLTGDLSAHAIALTLAAWSIGGTVEVVTLPEVETAIGSSASKRGDDGAARRFAYAAGATALQHWLRLASSNPAALADSGLIALVVDWPAAVSDKNQALAQALTVHPLRPLAKLLRMSPANQTGPMPSTSRPAASYWLEECSNDLIKLASLIDFWLAAKAALSLPASPSSQPAVADEPKRQVKDRTGNGLRCGESRRFLPAASLSNR